MNQETFSVGISPDFRRVVDRIDEIVVDHGSSRSAVVKEILYNHFGLVPETKGRVNNWSAVLQARNERKENV